MLDIHVTYMKYMNIYVTYKLFPCGLSAYVNEKHNCKIIKQMKQNTDPVVILTWSILIVSVLLSLPVLHNNTIIFSVTHLLMPTVDHALLMIDALP